jgi:hypothetical protein
MCLEPALYWHAVWNQNLFRQISPVYRQRTTAFPGMLSTTSWLHRLKLHPSFSVIETLKVGFPIVMFGADDILFQFRECGDIGKRIQANAERGLLKKGSVRCKSGTGPTERVNMCNC